MPAERVLGLRPAAHVERLDIPDRWIAHAAPVEFDLDPGGAGFPHGWVLLAGKLSRSILDGTASLADLDAKVAEGGIDPKPVSGGQERLESLVNRRIWNADRGA